VLVQAAALDVARADHHVVLFDVLRQHNDLVQRMGEVGVHLAHRLVAALDAVLEPGDISRPQAHPARPVDHVHAPVLLAAQFIRQLSGAVRAVIIDDQQFEVRYGQFEEGRNQSGKIFSLVIGRNNNRYFHW
jgi:hypothetical protein